MEEITKQIQEKKRRSMALTEEAKKLMRDAKQEQKRIRTRGLCIMGNLALSILGIRDIEQHQKAFEQICSSKQVATEYLYASLRELLRQEREKTAQKQQPTQE